ncbi:hypothetical protein PVK06_006809 [Gossypium arboreum]|uniref:Large ribosomal subunit protein uL10-like insertion domain-containing protein n=1 Tax=Gossypium arboreum TaxID=29729 RepID=A0ABR0QGD8_GOSAR|nr:hypothetical protein PVK06_006809 [Gossypium arboreum]
MAVKPSNSEADHLQNIRKGLRGDSVVLMGKNTVTKRSIRMHAEKTANQAFLNLIPLLQEDVGLIFTKGDLKQVNEEVAKYKVGAPARIGLVAPIDVVVPIGNTGVDPSQTSFSQVLNIPPKINKGTVEIVTPVELMKKGDKVVFSPVVLNLTENDLIEKFATGVSMVTALSLAISYLALAAAPHMLTNGYVLAVAAAPAEEEKKPEPDEESNDDMGFSLFDYFYLY